MPKKVSRPTRHSQRLKFNVAAQRNLHQALRYRKSALYPTVSYKLERSLGANHGEIISIDRRRKYDNVIKKRRIEDSKRSKEIADTVSYDISARDKKLASAGREEPKMERQEKAEAESSDYSPIKTRGFIKNKARVKDRCRICKSDTEPFMTCVDCSSEFHLVCLGYPAESADLVSKKRATDWQCPMCVLCSKCSGFIYDAENVQCFYCDRAYHGNCRPDERSNLSFSLSESWSCPDCKIEPSTSEIVLSKMDSKRSTGRRKGSFRKLVSADAWSDTGEENEIQKKRNQLNDCLKDECKARLLEESRRCHNLRKNGRQENCSPRKLRYHKSEDGSPILLTAVAGLSHECKVVDGIKVECFSDEEKEAVEIADKEAAESKMKQISILYDYENYKEAKAEANKGVPEDQKLGASQIVHFGLDSEFEAPHKSPYPKFLSESPHLYVCRFCLTAVGNDVKFESHLICCEWRHPPGNEIYRDGLFSFWEIDGEIEKSYCQRLCLFAKLFLSSKTLHREVEMFLFYLLTKHTIEGCVLIGYFSKEKIPNKNNNLSCLLTLPSSLRCGYGRYLIDLSYKLSLREKKVGGPEHPLSDLGLVTYRGYWKAVLFSYIRRRRPITTFSLKEITSETGIHPQDIVSTLRHCKMLTYREGNYYIDAKKPYMASLKSLRRRVVKDELLLWQPEFEVANERIRNYASNKPLF